MPPRRYTLRVAVCMACDQPFLSHYYGHERANFRRTCSTRCWRKVRSRLRVRRGRHNPRWRGGMPVRVCRECGGTFRRYDARGGRPRPFCSPRCAARAHRQSAHDMRGRLAFEHEARALLEAEGFRVLRSAGSRGPVDLFAFSPTEVRIIQVKSTNRLEHRGTRTMLRQAILDLLALPSPPGLTRWLFVRELRGNWFRECVEGWATDKKDCDDMVRQVIDMWTGRTPEISRGAPDG